MTSKRNSLKVLASASMIALGLVAALGSTVAQAQNKLKWAHVYETSEPITLNLSGLQKKSKSAPTASTRFKCFQLQPWAKKPTSTKA